MYWKVLRVDLFDYGCGMHVQAVSKIKCFLSYSLLLHIGRVHGENSRRTVLGGVHPVGTLNVTLISDT